MPSSVKAPDADATIDGRGTFLIPGFWDMHVHLATRPEPELAERVMLPLFLTHGIVGVRDMGGPLDRVLALRDSANDGTIGPRIITPGPFIDGPGDADPMFRRVTNAAEGRAAVKELAAAGVDFIKIQANISRDAYAGVLDEARLQHRVVAGHIPVALTAWDVVAAGQRSLEHMSPTLVSDAGVFFACSRREEDLARELRAIEHDRSSSTPDAISAREAALRMQLVDTYDRGRAAKLGRAIADRHAWIVPTLVFSKRLRPVSATDTGEDVPLEYVPAATRSRWRQAREQYLKAATAEDFAAAARVAAGAAKALGALHAAGARVLAGTDSFDGFVLPGTSLHEELELLVGAGLSPLEAMQAATRDAAEYRGSLKTEGTLEPGKRADRDARGQSVVRHSQHTPDQDRHPRRPRAEAARSRSAPGLRTRRGPVIGNLSARRPVQAYMETLWQDVRHGARTLLKTPGFVIAVALTLGLGIGANAAVFSIINTLLLRPLPVANPDNLYVLSTTHQDNEQPHQVSWKDFVDCRDRSGVFSELAAINFGFAGLSADGHAERITASYVTGNYFSMLGISPAYGRLILPSEGEHFGADPVLVLGHSYWKKRFNADPAVIGRTVLVNGQPFTIVGIVPETFTGTYAVVEFDAYMPYAMTYPEAAYKELITRRDNHDLRVLGRLKPGVSARQAQAGLDVLARQLEQQYPDTNKTVRFRMIPEHLARPEPNGADSNPFVAGVFLLLVGLVLLVACVNVVNLLLVRATVRHRELAVRAALGAGRARLVRQLLTESLMLAAAGGLTGAALGRWVSGLLAGMPFPADLPIRFDLRFDWRVFAYIATVALGTGIVAGLVPALRASRTDVNEVLREGGRGTFEGGTRQWLRNTLVVAQVAVSLVVLIAAGLFVRSVQHAQSVDLGFEHAHVLTLSMDASQLGYDEVRGRTLYREILRRVHSLPGVELASFAYSVPFGYSNSAEYVEAEARPIPKDQRRPIAGNNMVGPDYFRTMKIPIVRGRAFTEHDDQSSRPVAIVNELMTSTFWPGQDPIGKRFRTSADEHRWLEVVGVSKQGKYGYIFEDPRPYFFVPIEQQYRPMRSLQIRTAALPESLAPLVQREIHAIEANLPLYDVRSMTRMLDGGNGFFLLRMGALFGGGLGLLGLLLALVGIYGVVSFSASRRTQEIGVRMALGAQRGDILRAVVGRGLVLIAVGILLGISVALGVSQLLRNLLFGISAVDPITFVLVPLVLAAMAAVASYLPALRATRIDPVAALRQ